MRARVCGVYVMLRVSGMGAPMRSKARRAADNGPLDGLAVWLAGHGVALLEADETAAALWARHLEVGGV